MKNKSLVLVSLIILVAAFFAATSFYKSGEEKKIEGFAKNSNTAPFVRDYSPVFGENKKKITIVEFLDPQCEACAYYAKDINKIYKEHYEDISLVIRYLANHKNSQFTVMLLEASRKQNKFKEVLDVIFKTQDKWAIHNREKPELLWNLLKNVNGLDMEKLKKDVENIDISNILKTDRSDAQTLNVRGTPTIFINGKKLESISYEKMNTILEDLIYK